MADYAGQSGDFRDSRLILPLTGDGLTWPRRGNLSALYDQTFVQYWVRDGAEGSFSASPGAPVDIEVETGASEQNYHPDGATRFRASGRVSAYSGADSAGLEATPMWPLDGLVQRVALPLLVGNAGDGGNNGLAFTSPYEGTVKIYEWDPRR